MDSKPFVIGEGLQGVVTRAWEKAQGPAAAPWQHEPQAPYVHASAPLQRYFSSVGRLTTLSHIGLDSAMTVQVLRFAENTNAQLNIGVSANQTSSSTTIHLTAPELRTLAARLLDAAYDLETYTPEMLVAQVMEGAAA